jgi:murein L,D-transpeptidase YafK
LRSPRRARGDAVQARIARTLTVGERPCGTGAAACARARIGCGADTIVVLTEERALWLCTGGTPAARFTVALGRNGVGKRHRGDGRTPLGRYTVGAPRRSERYGTFIPISYPTPAQAARGFTGGTLGIHGPRRGMDAAAYPVTEVDWTLGCIATGSDEEVGTIAEFVRARRPAVVIR